MSEKFCFIEWDSEEKCYNVSTFIDNMLRDHQSFPADDETPRHIAYQQASKYWNEQCAEYQIYD